MTSNLVNDVVINWSAPTDDSITDFGDAILGYKVYIRTNAFDWEQDLIDCPNSNQFVCKLDVRTLQASPFNLLIGSSIYVKVVAFNNIGDGAESTPGNGAILNIIVQPDAPIGLSRDNSSTTQNQIGITW